MPESYRITSEGIRIKEDKIPAACYEIQELAQRVVKHHGLNYDVRVYCSTSQLINMDGYCLRIEFLDANSQPFGLLEYGTEPYLNDSFSEVFLFNWIGSTTTEIPGEGITLEEHVRRVLAHTFKPINKERRSCL